MSGTNVKIQFNYDMLRKLIRIHSGSVRQFAADVGMGYHSLMSRLSGKSFFTVEEIEKISTFFNLSPEAAKQCFFSLQSGLFAK